MSLIFKPGEIGPVSMLNRQLWLSHRIAISPGDRIHILFESFRKDPLQGLAVGCDNKRQKLRIAGQDRNRFVLWTDTAPRHVDAEFLPLRSSGQVHFMNVWEVPGHDRLRMSGINSASMAISEVRSDEWLLECSDGHGLEPPTLTDLIVRVVHERAASR